MATPLRGSCSRLCGWLADRRIPRRLRAPIFRAFARWSGADLSEVRLELEDHPSLGAFFVRRLREGARRYPDDPDLLPSPVDGTLQSFGHIRAGELLQAKGRPYPVGELLEGAAGELEGGHYWTVYLGPRDYHRIHSPIDGILREVRWFPGARYSVNPRVLARRGRVLSINERAVLRLEESIERTTTLFLVAVGALNVGRIRVVGVEPRGDVPPGGIRLRRGDELARFELGSTVVLISPPGGMEPSVGLTEGARVRMGDVLGQRVARVAPSDGASAARNAVG
jgi:phosphatidylserine decarboxylase